MLTLPPPYTELALREGHDSFDRAVAEARAGAGAGLLVWTKRTGSVEAAVLLEPNEDLTTARQVMAAGLAAVAEALLAISPPEKPLSLVWPDRVLFDGGLVGGGRLAWPEGAADGLVPDWLVFGFTLRTLSRSFQIHEALSAVGYDVSSSPPVLPATNASNAASAPSMPLLIAL